MRRYFPRLPPKWLLKHIVMGILLSAGCAWLFYRSYRALILALFIVPFYVRERYIQWVHESRQQMKQQFLSLIQIVSGSLGAGYSMENAWKSAEVDLRKLYGENAGLCREMRKMNQKLAMNEPLEQVFSSFASASGIEEICQFAEIFRYAKRSGGNLSEIIRNTTAHMQEKAEVMAEIENAVASRKMEQRMMNLLLPGVLLFITVSSPSYSDLLYHNVSGACVMTVCLIGYLVCLQWSKRITDIRV